MNININIFNIKSNPLKMGWIFTTHGGFSPRICYSYMNKIFYFTSIIGTNLEVNEFGKTNDVRSISIGL